MPSLSASIKIPSQCPPPCVLFTDYKETFDPLVQNGHPDFYLDEIHNLPL